MTTPFWGFNRTRIKRNILNLKIDFLGGQRGILSLFWLVSFRNVVKPPFLFKKKIQNGSHGARDGVLDFFYWNPIFVTWEPMTYDNPLWGFG